MRGRVAPSRDTYREVVSGTYRNRTKKTLQKQLSYAYNGEKQFIPGGAEFTAAQTIAGAGSNTALRAANRALRANMAVIPGSGASSQAKLKVMKYAFDVHWYELGGQQYDIKLKARKEKS